jgi:mannosyltransferase OCH1-like enzyme
MIYKTIYQTHNYEFDNLPATLKKTSETWIKLNPSWKYVYMDHNERDMFVKQENTDLYNIYKEVKPQIQADIWRYIITYKNGGVYADIDSICNMPLDQTLINYKEQDMVVFQDIEHSPPYFYNSNYYAKKENKLLKNIIDTFKNSEERYEYWTSMKCWNETIYNNLDKVLIDFSCFVHSTGFYEHFADFEINYYGKKMSYYNFLNL